ncbi:unnamed protein product [Lampetra planeri]
MGGGLFSLPLLPLLLNPREMRGGHADCDVTAEWLAPPLRVDDERSRGAACSIGELQQRIATSEFATDGGAPLHVLFKLDGMA